MDLWGDNISDQELVEIADAAEAKNITMDVEDEPIVMIVEEEEEDTHSYWIRYNIVASPTDYVPKLMSFQCAEFLKDDIIEDIFPPIRELTPMWDWTCDWETERQQSNWHNTEDTLQRDVPCEEMLWYRIDNEQKYLHQVHEFYADPPNERKYIMNLTPKYVREILKLNSKQNSHKTFRQKTSINSC